MELSSLNNTRALQPTGSTAPKTSVARQQPTPAQSGSGSAALQPRGPELEQAARHLAQNAKLRVELGEDQETGRTVVRIFSRDGERLLRQMPPEELLRLAARAQEEYGQSLLDSRV